MIIPKVGMEVYVKDIINKCTIEKVRYNPIYNEYALYLKTTVEADPMEYFSGTRFYREDTACKFKFITEKKIRNLPKEEV